VGCSGACNATFEDLFLSTSAEDDLFLPSSRALPTLNPPLGAIELFVHTLRSVLQEPRLTDRDLYFISGELFLSIPENAHAYKVWLIGADIYHILDDTTCVEFIHSKSAVYRALLPVPSVHEVVTQVWNTIFRRRMVVGVHARVFDQRFDYPLYEDVDATTFDQLARVESFQEVRKASIRSV
jgi:hypothetical protein